MQAYIKYKAYCDKKANASKNKQADYSLILQPKQITKGVKFPLQIFAGSDHIILKRRYQTITFWYAKLALIGRKSFIK